MGAWREGVAAAALAAGWPVAQAGPQAALLVDAGLSVVLRPSLQVGYDHTGWINLSPSLTPADSEVTSKHRGTVFSSLNFPFQAATFAQGPSR